MLTPLEKFEMELNGVTMKVEELDFPGYVAFNVIFSSKRLPLVVARARNSERKIFWTSSPEGRQTEAEGVGKLIEDYFKKKEK
jgi:hypothetical protein